MFLMINTGHRNDSLKHQATALLDGNSLDGSLDLIIGSRLLKPNSQINNRNIDSGDTESHSSQLSIEGRKHLANSLRDNMGLQQDNQNKEAMRVLITYRRIYMITTFFL